MSKRAGVTVLFAALALPHPAAGQGRPVDIRVSYTIHAEGQRGVARPRDYSANQVVQARLFPNGRVEELNTTDNGRTVTENRQQNRLGRGSGVAWRASANELVRTAELPTYLAITRVQVTGQTCRASITYNLRPGNDTYAFASVDGRQQLRFAVLRSSRIACQIGDAPAR